MSKTRVHKHARYKAADGKRTLVRRMLNADPNNTNEAINKRCLAKYKSSVSTGDIAKIRRELGCARYGAVKAAKAAKAKTARISDTQIQILTDDRPSVKGIVSSMRRLGLIGIALNDSNGTVELTYPIEGGDA